LASPNSTFEASARSTLKTSFDFSHSTFEASVRSALDTVLGSLDPAVDASALETFSASHYSGTYYSGTITDLCSSLEAARQAAEAALASTSEQLQPDGQRLLCGLPVSALPQLPARRVETVVRSLSAQSLSRLPVRPTYT
jgi:hypothetical protein